jgi:hypothetical protein
MGAAGRGSLLPASLGALAAFCLIVLLGSVLRRPVSIIPENILKFAVGVLLCAFGTFWVGEGAGIAWPGAELSLVGLCLGFLLAAGDRFCLDPTQDARAGRIGPMSGNRVMGTLALFRDELWGNLSTMAFSPARSWSGCWWVGGFCRSSVCRVGCRRCCSSLVLRLS